MRSHRHAPITVPIGHAEQPSRRQAIPVMDIDADTRADYAALDRPTVTRRAEAPAGWLDLDAEVRAEIRGIAVDQLRKRLGDARNALYRAVAEERPSLHLSERVARLERSMEMVRSWP